MTDLSQPAVLPPPKLVGEVGSGAWGVPEWQRTFDARPEFVAKLADSLYRRMLIGILTLWQPVDTERVHSRYLGASPATAADGQQQLLDGQQRATSLALMHG